jgi:EAL domain-containing protein (putative c-di-GMP-specific phosphodiesterase class I)/DNA-binding NarL/FixJ family response regulator
MNKEINIFSLSPALNEINRELKPLIQPINVKSLIDKKDSIESLCVLFQWHLLSDVIEAKRQLAENRIFGVRFICVNSDLMPEERLKLLNSNIEFLTLEKFKNINSYFFKLDCKNKKYKILFIEDDESQIETTENILKDAHINVFTVRKYDDIITEIDSYQPDLILLDFNFDDASDDNIVNTIRNSPKYTIIPIIILTSNNSENSRVKVLNAGADDLLTKPINPELLVSALINRMERSKKVIQQSRLSISEDRTTIHSFEQTEFDELGMFLDLNRDNPYASIIWLKIVNITELQKELGFFGYRNFCNKILNEVMNYDVDFEVKLYISDAVFVFAAADLPRIEAIEWVQTVSNWLKSNYFSINGIDYYCDVHPIVLTDIHKKPEIEYLISSAESLIIESHTSEEITFVAEGIEEKHFFLIKSQLEHSIQVRNFKWWYQTIVSTKDPNQEIYQLFIRVISNNNKEIASKDFFDVASKTGLLKLFDRFTFEHSLRIISLGRSDTKQRRVLINQLASDFESKLERQRKIATITELNVPDNSLIFQFRLDNIEKFSHTATSLGNDLRKAKISICLSNFDCSNLAWQLVDLLKPDWIRILPLKTNPEWMDPKSDIYIEKTISKAHELNIKVMISEVDSSEFAANLWNLNIDYLQGNFIQTPILEEFLSV